MRRHRKYGLIGIAAGVLAAVVALFVSTGEQSESLGSVLIGEARRGGLTLALPAAVADVRIREARVPGRPIVLIDPGHGGRDPGASGVSGQLVEKQLTLAMAQELADLLERRGRVRVAMTREDDHFLTLEQRAALARRIGASMFLSLHMDSAPNALASGATIYSLSEVASSAEAARFAAVENRSGEALSSEADDSLRVILGDLALRGQMEQSAGLAGRLARRAAGRLELRPNPHQFAAFEVLRRAEVPALLIEAGYISNVDDEVRLASVAGRAPMVLALAQAVEADLASRLGR